MEAPAPAKLNHDPMPNLLARLEGTRGTGAGKWQARCPSHDDRTPSLSIRELPDGTILLHCWAGCSANDVIRAVGLELRDLFPARTLPQNGKPPERRPWAIADAIKTLRFEALIVLIAAKTTLRCEKMNDDDMARLSVAAGRINDIADTLRIGA